MFDSKSYLPEPVLARLTAKRVADPDYALRAARARLRRKAVAPTGKLNILAADHPARKDRKSVV